MSSSDGSRLEKFELMGSWDVRKEGKGVYNLKSIERYFGILPDLSKFEVSSDEIRSHSGSTIFRHRWRIGRTFLTIALAQIPR